MLKNIVNFYLTGHARRRVKEIRDTYSRPLRLQEKALFSILDKARYTEFGREYGFKSIKSIDAYRKRVPLFQYEDMRTWIAKAIKGGVNVTWPGRIWNFALTSGTTSGDKYIPVSKDSIAISKKAALDCLSFYLSESGDRRILNGKFLFLGGSTSLKQLKKGAFAGDLSGIISRAVPLMFKSIYEPGREIAHIPDWEEKISKIAQKDVDEDIRGLSGVPSWLIVFFGKLLEEAGKRSGNRVKTVAEVWPDLSLLVHGGVSFSPYRELLREVIGKDVYYLEIYPASEAFMAIQDKKEGPGMLLMLDYENFYEFVPEEEINNDHPARLTVAEVEKNKNYAIIITNNSGLYSYVLGDTVKFVDLDPLRLTVTGRIKNFLSAFGEHLIVKDADDAISYACKMTDSKIEDYTVAPLFRKDLSRLPCHQWLIEFIREPSDAKGFIRYLDKRLREGNADYDAHRGRDISVGLPEVIKLRKGAFYDWMKSEGKLGGQHKVPRLQNDRSIAEKLIAEGPR
ncbi:MAG: GH3 auxin-responsive promoter family protein [Candidatus Omnitrophica bacterium]|nr:GH3 auxin-responsive promoter family protein [Candidatus Omnitrophota bacterium]